MQPLRQPYPSFSLVVYCAFLPPPELEDAPQPETVPVTIHFDEDEDGPYDMLMQTVDYRTGSTELTDTYSGTSSITADTSVIYSTPEPSFETRLKRETQKPNERRTFTKAKKLSRSISGVLRKILSVTRLSERQPMSPTKMHTLDLTD